MPKRKPNKRYTPEFKKLVIETMSGEKLSYSETSRQFSVSNHHRIQDWERIYLTDGLEVFAVEPRGRKHTKTRISNCQNKWKRICLLRYNGCGRRTST